LPPINATTTGFVAQYDPAQNSTGTQLDVSETQEFGTYVVEKIAASGGGYTVPGLNAGKLYYYRAFAVNSASLLSDASGTQAAYTVPSNPNADAASNITSSSFTANWSGNSGEVVSGYKLDVCRNSQMTDYVSGFQGKDITGSTSASVSGLVPATQYWYRVRAYNTAGESESSGSAQVETGA
jgi:phosphodiesterase/alkaline phosphatase D-like protein